VFAVLVTKKRTNGGMNEQRENTMPPPASLAW